MKIKTLKINNFLGISEYNLNPSSVNVFEGVKGAGKSSILEAIETALTNIKRRTEVVKHGEEEATLYIELDDGLEISRKLRTGKADYFKLAKEGKGVKTSETELRKLLSGDIFRPLDFISMKQAEQTAIILNMIKMDYSAEEVREWFDINVSFDESKHLLQILKGIETNLYDERQEVNRYINTLKNQISGIEKELPPNYKGDEWKAVNVKEYYAKVTDAQKINGLIAEATRLKESIDSTIEGLTLKSENAAMDIKLENAKLAQSIKDDISRLRNQIILKENDLINLEEKENQSIKDIKENLKSLTDKENERVVKAAKYLEENSLIDIEPLEKEIDNITTMQSYVREWEKTLDLKTKLAEEESKSQVLTEAIKTAREKPSYLLRLHELPIDGISIDDNSCIRINGTLLDGLSDGEKLEAAFKIALQRIGELRIMCLDGFEKLNLTEQKKVVELCEQNDIQAFITVTTDVAGITTKAEL